MTDSGHRLLDPLSPDQQALVDAVFDAYDQYNTWPNFHFLERQLANPGIAGLIATFPTLRGVHYGAVWAMSTGGVHLADQQVGLTVAGLAHVRGGERRIDPFLTMLRRVAARLSSLPLHPTEIATLSLEFSELVGCVRTGAGDSLLSDVEGVTRLIPHEPATWQGIVSGEGEHWRWLEVPWHITRFGDVATTEEYLAELAEFVRPVAHPAYLAELPPPPSPSGGAHEWIAMVHPGLLAHIADHVEAARWSTAVRESAVYLEHELRSRSHLGPELVGVELVTAALRPGTGPLAMPPTGPRGEQDGWHALGRGFMGAVRNHFAHALHPISEQMAAGAIYSASLILVALDETFPPED